MDEQKSELIQLTREQSSLLRSSPTIRSSIHSVSSANEGEIVSLQVEEEEEDEKRNPRRPSFSSRPSGSSRIGAARVFPIIVFSSLLYIAIFYLRTEDLTTSQNLLLALFFIAVALLFLKRNRKSIRHALGFLQHVSRKLWNSRGRSKSVQWSIGGELETEENPRGNREMREGVEFYSNGNFYEGEFDEGKCNGSGVYNYFVNGRYEGDWIDGRYDGHGIESWARGSRYKGRYSKGRRDGFGVYKFFTGDSYSGEWCNGQSHGVGVQTCSDGSCYIGEFKHGAKHGLGIYHFRNGDRYSGEYFGDRIHGYGVYQFANGHCYEGSWHEGHKQGLGMYTFRNGETQSGEWDGDAIRHHHHHHRSAVLTEPVILSVEIAREMGENARKVKRVDEHVSRAVMEAKRSATAARVAAIRAAQSRAGRSIL